MFKVNGLVHGREPVFSDGIYYTFKGGKLLNCSLHQINENLHASYLQSKHSNSWFRTEHTIKAVNLPKSFGCQVSFDQSLVRR